jgi:glucoside 3-dehydrogenase (cytochrome c) hitch-hiker subunit
MDRREVLHLLGGAVAVPALSGYTLDDLLVFGRRLNLRTSRPARELHLFDPHQSTTVAALAERIIPETDTPGARAARVPEFIELVVAENFTDQERERFLAGIRDVDSRAGGGRNFVDLPAVEQDRILSQLEAQAVPFLARKPPEKKLVAPFWAQIKFLTIYGYYTSEIGVNRELHTVVIPGRYDPCVATGVPGPRGR